MLCENTCLICAGALTMFFFSHYTGDIVLFENAKVYYPGEKWLSCLAA